MKLNTDEQWMRILQYQSPPPSHQVMKTTI
jgi:hypothetical protein